MHSPCICRKKPIEECITYKAQCQGIKLAVHTTQSVSGSLSPSGTGDETSSKTKDTMLQSYSPVIESRFICRQPPHTVSRSSSSQQSAGVSSLSGESAGVLTSTMQLQADNDGK